jgi:hypothetical protein
MKTIRIDWRNDQEGVDRFLYSANRRIVQNRRIADMRNCVKKQAFIHKPFEEMIEKY